MTDSSAAGVLAAWLLPGRGSPLLELVVLTMLFATVALGVSVAAARLGGRYRLHRGIQIGLSILLAVVLVAFEIDVRFVTDWRSLAEPSPWFERGRFNVVYAALAVHLCVAIPTPFVWFGTLFFALRRFGRDPMPGAHSPRHRVWGWMAFAFLFLTSATGWVFFYLAFVATEGS